MSSKSRFCLWEAESLRFTSASHAINAQGIGTTGSQDKSMDSDRQGATLQRLWWFDCAFLEAIGSSNLESVLPHPVDVYSASNYENESFEDWVGRSASFKKSKEKGNQIQNPLTTRIRTRNPSYLAKVAHLRSRAVRSKFTSQSPFDQWMPLLMWNEKLGLINSTAQHGRCSYTTQTVFSLG